VRKHEGRRGVLLEAPFPDPRHPHLGSDDRLDLDHQWEQERPL